MKKHLYYVLFACLTGLIMTACGSDGDDDFIPRKDSGSLKSGMLEVPALKGGSSILVTHVGTLNDRSGFRGVNYRVEWDTEKASQRWSCYKFYKTISAKNVYRYDADNDGSLSPNCQYPNDPDLPAEFRFATGEDPYKSSGYDHGHICPSADRQAANEANYQTFYITNMQPQNNKFNAGIWSSMETQVRNWTSKFDTLYVVKGGTIDKAEHIYEYVFRNSHQKTRVNNKHIPVPRYFFMAVLGRYNNIFRATAYWIDQSSYSSQTPKDYAINVAELEQKTGIDFFPNLPDDIEVEVENVSRSQMLNDWY